MLSRSLAVFVVLSYVEPQQFLLQHNSRCLKAEASVVPSSYSSTATTGETKKDNVADVNLADLTRTKAKWRDDSMTPTLSAKLPRQTEASLTHLPLPYGASVSPTSGSRRSGMSTQGQPSSKGCGPGNRPPLTVLSSFQGEVEWTGESGECQRAWALDVQLEEAVGLVLHFPVVDVRSGQLLVYQGPQLVARISGSLPVSPIIVPAPRARLHLVAQPPGLHPHSVPPPRLVFSYTAEAARTLPAPVDVGGRRRYNCSPPSLVPRALRCDMVQQCVGGQDETDCAYRRSHCGPNFIHLHSICYTFVFPTRPVSWLQADLQCTKHHDATLGELISDEAKQLAANLTSMNGREDLIVGLKKSFRDSSNIALHIRQFYRFAWVWNSLRQLELEGPSNNRQNNSEDYGVLRVVPYVFFASASYADSRHDGYVCMTHSLNRGPDEIDGSQRCMRIDDDKYQIREKFHLQVCADGSLRQTFYHCIDGVTQSEIGFRNHPVRLYECDNNHFVHYTVVCDGNFDCPDSTDEIFCVDTFLRKEVFEAGNIESNAYFVCNNLWYYSMPMELRCNGQLNCGDSSDEKDCKKCSQGLVLSEKYGCIPPPQSRSHLLSNTSADYSPLRNNFAIGNNDLGDLFKVLQMNGFGSVSITFTRDDKCAESHIQCPDGTCIPSYLSYNYVYDCPYQSNEKDYEESSLRTTCPGYYHCEKSRMNLHPMYYCDGFVHCFRGDDEMYCGWTCPDGCKCVGQEFTCVRMFDPIVYPLVSYLDLSNVPKPPVSEVEQLPFLKFLNLSNCNLRNHTLNGLLLLYILDLSHNELKTLNESWLSSAISLRHLNLSANPLIGSLNKDSFFLLFPRDLSASNLKGLSLSDTKLRYITPKAFSHFVNLQRLDLRRTPGKSIVRGMFFGLDSLDTLLVSDERLCCQYHKEVGKLRTCVAPVNELSSCDDLLKTVNFRVALWLQSLLAVTGNAGVFVFRTVWQRKRAASSFRVLVSHLSLADALMGVYLSIIGAADAQFRGQYLWEGEAWTSSVMCRMAGFLALLSSEVSALVICLITLDRWLMFRFPFDKSLHFTFRRSLLACSLAWAVGMTLAAVPLLPAFGHWRFYSQTAICLPLPITRHQFPGQAYSFAVFIALNLTLFLLIGLGQASIYLSIRATSTAGRSDRGQQDAAVARRLSLVVATDFCCWFPVGVMGLAAARGSPISERVNVWVAVFLLPLNAALNPFLYTLNAALDARQRKRDKVRLQRVLRNLAVHVHTWPMESVRQLLHQCHLALKTPVRQHQLAAQSEPDPHLASSSTLHMNSADDKHT